VGSEALPALLLNGFSPSDVTVTLTAFNILGSQFAGWVGVAKHSQSSESCEMRNAGINCTTENTLTTGILSLH
jgi:hypothetical protein